MNIVISNTGNTPIYEQILTQIKNIIISGILKEGEALPSIRNLAKDLKISVITTKRAYEELEKDGFIYSVVGKGCFVAPQNLELLREANLRKIEEHLLSVIELSKSCNLSEGDIMDMFKMLKEENL